MHAIVLIILGIRGGIVSSVLIRIRVLRGDVHGFQRELHGLNKRDAAAYQRPGPPTGAAGGVGKVMCFGVDLPVVLAHGDGPVELAPHHDALDHGRASNVGAKQLAVFCQALVGACAHGGLHTLVHQRAYALAVRVGFGVAEPKRCHQPYRN